MRVYWLPNVDGSSEALVAAMNQKEASRLMGSSLNGFKSYGGRRYGTEPNDDPDMVSLVLNEPNVVWYRKIDQGPQTDRRWKKERTNR